MNQKCHDCLTDIITSQIQIQQKMMDLLMLMDMQAERINEAIEAAVVPSPVSQMRKLH